VAYHAWLKGASPRGRRLEHLSGTLSCLRNAESRIGNPSKVASWLLTPISGTRQTPFELLRAKEFDRFSGAFVRANPLGNPVRKSVPRKPKLARANSKIRKQALRRHGQAAAIEDDE